MTAQELLETNGIRLKSYAPGQYSTTCPRCSAKRSKAHQRTPCLSVKIDAQGARWHCNHCPWSGPPKGSPKGPRTQHFAATYDYHDKDGILQFQKVKNLPGSKNRFFMRRPDGHGGWINDTKDVDTSILYRLPEVIEAIALGHEIICVEGEKDVDRLWSIGIPATCNAHGAAEPGKQPKWKPEHSKQLAGAPIVVMPDHDDAGYAHADATCECSHGVAKRVRRLALHEHWPNCPKGGDVSDWLDAGHTREDLDTLLAGAPDYVSTSPKLTATPHVWRDPSTISPRDFTYGNDIVRRYVSGVVSMGGVGKTSEVQVEVVAMITGRDLLGVKPKRAYCVWYINLEDPRDEIDRRFAAIFKHYKITPKDLGNRLFTDSGREKNFVIAREDRKNGLIFDRNVIADISNTIAQNGIEVIVIDPFVNCVQCGENDNNTMARIVEAWATLAEKHDCAIVLVHHVRKGASGRDGYTVEDARGAGAMINSCRSVRVLNTMTKEEGERAGVERHRSYFRIDGGKVNLVPPPEDSEWRKIISIDLENATADCPSDHIGVVTQWEWPDPTEEFTVADLRAAQKAVSEGGPWRKDVQAKNWVGKPIAKALKLDLDSAADKQKVKGALKIWIKNQMFKEVERWDNKKSRKVSFIEVGIWANDSKTFRMKPSSRKSPSAQPKSDDHGAPAAGANGAAQAKPAQSHGAPVADTPNISPGRIRELEAWVIDQAAIQNETNGDVNRAEIEEGLLNILRKETACPAEVEAAFKKVMDQVFAV
jgi:hypothetical protein